MTYRNIDGVYLMSITEQTNEIVTRTDILPLPPLFAISFMLFPTYSPLLIFKISFSPPLAKGQTEYAMKY